LNNFETLYKNILLLLSIIILIFVLNHKNHLYGILPLL
jgi:hypothetical protein